MNYWEEDAFTAQIEEFSSTEQLTIGMKKTRLKVKVLVYFT